MAGKNPKTKVVAFKVEEELADFLNQLPNKSAFIRKSIAAQMSMACPLCNGSGIVSRWSHDHYAPLIEEWNSQNCAKCGDDLPLPRDPGELVADAKSRLEQYFHGGPLYCGDCYEEAPECDDCGWHIDEDKVAEHKKDIHTQ